MQSCHDKMKVLPTKLGNDDLIRIHFIKYLGVIVQAGVQLCVDVDVVRLSFYAACNSIISNSLNHFELLRLQLLKSILFIYFV
jgi:hypothetical protein